MQANTGAARCGLSHKRVSNLDRFLFGVCYYPEHWDRPTRRNDAQLMRAAHINTVRMAEFAWNIIEPREGVFCFDLFDETIEQLSRADISTILCTPTATPPRWLTIKHPDILSHDKNGVPRRHGSRQHCNLAHPVFRQYSRAITSAMAGHYKNSPHVIAWQTDNEFNCHNPLDFSPATEKAFQEWLQTKYSVIQSLNDAWGTAFWAQTYDDFCDIPLPVDHQPTYANPSAMLDFARFTSDRTAAFQHEQVEILRKNNPRWKIFHNGTFAYLDYRGRFTLDLDILGQDVYPHFAYNTANRRDWHGFNLDCARAWSGNFIIPEQQCGPGAQNSYCHDTPAPGELRRMTYVSIARGADSLLYFRWRTCPFGAEMYWRGVLDHDNVPRQRYEEVAQTGRELEKVGPVLTGTHVHVDAAVAGADMEQAAAHDTMTMGLPSTYETASMVRSVIERAGYAAGVVHPSDDLTGLKLYIIPHWVIIRPEWIENLSDWVKNGGTLVLGARCGTRDINNHVVREPLPGLLRPLCKATVTEYSKRNDPEGRPLWLQLGEHETAAGPWYEELELEGAEALCTWRGLHLDRKPAVTVTGHGTGRVVYVGTVLTKTVVEFLLPVLAEYAGLQTLWPDCPPQVEVIQRRAADRRLWFFVNHGSEPAKLPTVPAGTDLLTGQPAALGHILSPNDVLIVEQRL